MKRAKNLWIKEDKPKTGTFYGTDKYISDGTNRYQLFQRGRESYLGDIPIGVLDIGIIERGYFCLCFKAHPKTKNFFKYLEQREKFLKRTGKKLNDMAAGLIKAFKEKQ